ncbi:Fic family protein [Gulosibacter chungangensis]|uniref:Fic family protein n=1 Tax=Gulosibacter chungangensis TaxID=979746 RepID=A0A7J5BBK0_9MICO|nr:Fic family protein [Gulosibacter chungangensis]KAB1643523.1 Fic family protein [Gulosibacter chungangensis]
MKWPSTTTVTETWRPNPGKWADQSKVPHFGEPYSASIPPSIATLDVQLPGAIAADLERSTMLLRDFDAEFGAQLSPVTALLIRSESLSSSQIENVSAKARQVVSAEIGESENRNAKLIAAGGTVILDAIRNPGQIDVDLAKRIQAGLLADSPDLSPGELRQEPIWIGSSSVSPHGAEYVAPPAAMLPQLLNDWSEFVARTDIPVLAHTILAHGQFEAIHPFRDGNGRTGRALIQAMLRARGATRHVAVPISSGFLMDTDHYFSALIEYEHGNPLPLLQATVLATDSAVANARLLVTNINDIRDQQRAAITARSDSRIWELHDYSIRQPVFTANMVAEALVITTSNVQRNLDLLVDAEVLIASASVHRGRGRVYLSPGILDELDRFADRAARRVA